MEDAHIGGGGFSTCMCVDVYFESKHESMCFKCLRSLKWLSRRKILLKRLTTNDKTLETQSTGVHFSFTACFLLNYGKGVIMCNQTFLSQGRNYSEKIKCNV